MLLRTASVGRVDDGDVGRGSERGGRTRSLRQGTAFLFEDLKHEVPEGEDDTDHHRKGEQTLADQPRTKRANFSSTPVL